MPRVVLLGRQEISIARFILKMAFRKKRSKPSEVRLLEIYNIIFWNEFIYVIGMGHDARVVSGFSRGLMGRGQVIQKLQDPSGCFVWAAGSDLRADGHAAAQI